MVRLSASRRNSAEHRSSGRSSGGSSPSPENEKNDISASRSPKRSPVMLRKPKVGGTGSTTNGSNK